MARCINKEHPEFLDLVKEMGIDPIKLETNIIFWQDENNKVGEFPTRRELIKFINKKNGNLRQSIGSSRVLRTIYENEEENIINNGVLFFHTKGKQTYILNNKEVYFDYNTSMNVYLKGVYNRMLNMKALDSAEELKRKLELVKDKIARAYTDLLQKPTYNEDTIKSDYTTDITDENILINEKTTDVNKEDEVGSLDQFWTDSGFMAVNSLDKASLLLKRNISFLSKRDKEGKIIYDRFGNPELLELEPTYNYLLNNLAESGNKAEMMSRLENISNNRSEFKPLYENLVNPRNKQLSAQFFTLMNFAKNESSITKVLFDKKKKGVSTKVLDADRVNASKQIFKQWQKNFNDIKISSNLVTEETIGNSTTEKLNKDKFRPIYDRLNSSKKSYDKTNDKETLYKSWVGNLKLIGVTTDIEAYNIYIQDNNDLLNDINDQLTDVFKYAFEEGEFPLDDNFVGQLLSKIQSGYQDVDSNSTFTNIEGNKNQSFIIPFALNKLMNSYKSENGINILNSLSQDPSFHNSHLINVLKDYPQDVNYKVEGGIKEDTPTSEGVSYSSMSPLELEFTKLVKFISGTRKASKQYGGTETYIGQVFTLVPSDGSTMPTLQVPIIHGTYTKSNNPAFLAATGVNKELNYNDTYTEMLFDLFSQEQIRVREASNYRNRILELKAIENKTPEQIQELKNLEDNAIELYDFKYDKGEKNYSKGAATQLHDFDIFTDESKYNSTIKPTLGITFQDAQVLLQNFNYELAKEDELFELEDNEGNTYESKVRINIDPEVKNNIKNILYAWLINKKQNQYNIWNRLGILSDKFKLSEFVGPNLKYSNYEELALEFVFNSFLYSSETQKLFTGDVSFAGSKVNYQKRAKSIVSPSITPDLESMDRDTYKLGIIRDIIKPSEYLDSIKQGLENTFKDIVDPIERNNKINSILNSYKNINVGDGMGYLHYEEALNIYKGLGTYYEKYVTQLEKLKSGDNTDIDYSILLPMMKDNHVSVVYDPIRKITVKKYIKNAKFILFPALVKDTPLQVMYDYMTSSGTHHILFESGIKQGAKGVEELKTKDNKYDIFKVDNIVPEELSYEFWGLQSDTPEHHIDAENKQGVQVAKLITQGLDDNFKFSDGTKAKTLKEEYTKLQADNIREDYQDFIKAVKTDKDVRNLLLEQLSDLSDNAIELFDLDDNGNFKSPLFLNMDFCKKIESTLNGLYKNRVVNQKMNGGSFKQASVFGLTNKQNFTSSLESIPDQYKTSINWLKGNEDKLDFYTYDNGKIKSAQCLLPYWSKEFIKDGSIIDINDLPSELRQIIGYRIPTQSKSSMFALEVVGFLPKEVGSTVVLPEEVTVLMGSDFDIDTLYTMIPNFKKFKINKRLIDIDAEIIQRNKDAEELNNIIIENNNINKSNTIELESLKINNTAIDGLLKERKKVESDEKTKSTKDDKDYVFRFQKIEGDSREGRENRIQDIFRKILLEPKLLNETIAPLDSDTLKNVKSRALNLTNIPEVKDSVNLPYIQTDMSLNNMMGKDLIGVFANYNANRSIAEDTKLKIVDEDYSIKFNGTEATELFNKINIKGNNIASQISEMLSAAVDNAKELTHYIINSNTYTASVYALILESGHDLTTASYFMLQPGIVKAYNKQKTNSGINREFVNIIQSIKDEYLNKLSKSSRDSINKELSNNRVFNFTDNKMQEAIVISRYLNLIEKKSPITFEKFINRDDIKSLGLDFSTWNDSNILEEYSIYQIQALHSFESYRVLSAQRGLILKNQKIDGYNGNSLAHLEIFKTNIDNANENTKLLSYDDSNLSNQKELYKALLGDTKNSAINFISKYIPFSTPAFTQAKNSIIAKLGIQDKLKSAFTGEKILSKINYELLTAINGNRKSPFFKNKSSSEYLKQLVIDKGLYNSYIQLTKDYPFLKDNYFVRKITFNDSKELIFNIGILQNRSSERLQNAFQELIEGFSVPEADKQRVEDFATDLIRYSYLTKGFQSGFDSFIKYVPSEWLQSDRLGYNDFMKDVEYNLQNPNFIENKLIDEVISNLSNLDGIVSFPNPKDLADPKKFKDLPEYIKVYNSEEQKVLLLKKNYEKQSYSTINSLGRKANGKRGVLLKEYSGEGLNFTERPIVEESSNINSLGKPLINPTSIKDKGEDLEKECNN